MSQVAANDPGNAHGVVYMWGTHGIGYNKKMLAVALPRDPVDNWRLIFDPAFASKLSKCGINIIDKPAGVARLVQARRQAQEATTAHRDRPLWDRTQLTAS
jgi:putrescine transport system substrate-binding protein